MASKFLNLSTDTTLGGNAPSDEIVSSQKALKTYIDNNAGGGGLPDQTGNSGKFLTTDGTNASWSDKPLVNTATGTNALSILGLAAVQTNGVALGKRAYAYQENSVGIGYEAYAYGKDAVAIGKGAVSGGTSMTVPTIAIGSGSQAGADYSIGIGGRVAANGTSKYGITIGFDSKVGQYAPCAMQFGKGTNNTAGTVQFSLSSDASTWTDYRLLDSNGTIPTDRFTTTPSADGTYVPTLTISSGTATRSWTSIASSVSSSSTNTETVGAKLFYDTCGDIETLINAL